MKKVLVFGAGLIGGFITNQLSKKYEVTVYDGNVDNLYKLDSNIKIIAKFIKSQEMRGIIDFHNPDIIVNALPGHLGHNLLKTAVSAGKNIVDISFMPEDPLTLNEKAIENNVTAVVDFGFAPGMCHMFVGRANKLLDKHDESIIYVGGLQLFGADYKAVFSPVDVIQEYIRPARYLKDGKIETAIPFHHYRYGYEQKKGHIASLSGFISDGLRTLLGTLDVPNIIEITLRTPKHFVFIQSLIENGFFKEEHLENTSKVLIDKWKMTKDDYDYSILDVVSKGDGKKITHFMYDQYDTETETHSMARVTGLPAVAMVEAVLEGRYTEKGVIPPEYVAKNDEIYNFVVEYLQEHGITITTSYGGDVEE